MRQEPTQYYTRQHDHGRSSAIGIKKGIYLTQYKENHWAKNKTVIRYSD